MRDWISFCGYKALGSIDKSRLFEVIVRYLNIPTIYYVIWNTKRLS